MATSKKTKTILWIGIPLLLMTISYLGYRWYKKKNGGGGSTSKESEQGGGGGGYGGGGYGGGDTTPIPLTQPVNTTVISSPKGLQQVASGGEKVNVPGMKVNVPGMTVSNGNISNGGGSGTAFGNGAGQGPLKSPLSNNAQKATSGRG